MLAVTATKLTTKATRPPWAPRGFCILTGIWKGVDRCHSRAIIWTLRGRSRWRLFAPSSRRVSRRTMAGTRRTLKTQIHHMMRWMSALRKECRRTWHHHFANGSIWDWTRTATRSSNGRAEAATLSQILCKHPNRARTSENDLRRQRPCPQTPCLQYNAGGDGCQGRRSRLFTLDIPARLCYSGMRSAKKIDSCAWIARRSCRLPVHFFVMSAMARYSIFSRLSSVGNADLALVTLRSWRLKPSMALVL